MTALVPLAAPVGPAFGYWELTPQVDVGITTENNPRYISDEAEAAQNAINPAATANVLGVFTDALVRGAYKTPTSEISLTPRIRNTNYLKSNKDLNDDDLYVDLLGEHVGALGSIALSGRYQETGIRTSEFESATPSNPDDPGPVTGGSGRFSEDTQKTWNLRPSLTYQLSTRNLIGISGQFAETTYDEGREVLLSSRDYLDYTYSSVDVSLRHVLDARNYFALALNGGNFLADEAGRLFSNSSDSFGITGAYNRIFSDTLSGSITLGVTRSSIDVAGIIGGFDPLTGALCLPSNPCSTSNEERNFVGSLDLRKRSELTILNFSVGSQIAPRSDGTEVIQEQVRLYVDRRLTTRLGVTLGGLYSRESAVGQIFQPETASLGLARQDRDYFTVDTGLSWRLTETLSVYGTYSYVSDTTDLIAGGNVHQTNNRLYLGVRYRGVGIRR
ncbi:MAG: hypothetical protein JNK40_13070 [Chromatiales bacterium]|nr:hypothetical protein [Chromatiales bacterium]